MGREYKGVPFMELNLCDLRIPEALKSIFRSRPHGRIQNDIGIMESPFHTYWVDTQSQEIQTFFRSVLERTNASIHDIEGITWFPYNHSTHIRIYYWEWD